MTLHLIALLLLACVSIWLFGLTVYRRFVPLVTRRAGFTLDDLPKRIWRVFLEVLLQYKVIRNRPVIGILHALVMWGFFVFSWISFKHVFVGIFNPQNIALMKHDNYDAFAAYWAMAVLIGIIGLSIRRFVFRPKCLGKLSATSGVIALLITVLMATHLFSWMNLSENSTVIYANWWLHTLSLFSILVIVPRSKHLHLALAPIAIFLRPETTSKMRPLDIENEDFGMVNFSDLSMKDVLDLNACVECGRCTEVCPANISGGSLDPKSIILNMRSGLLSGGNVIVGDWIKEEDLFQCLSCGACEFACPVGIEHVGSKILDLRRGLVSEGRIENEKIMKLYSTMERAPHNPWGISQEARRKFVEKEQFPVFDGSQKWLFWLGCGLSYDQHGQKVAKAMKEILNTAGVSWGIIDSETCCGEPARRTGNEALYLELSEKLIDKLKQSGAKKIVSCSPHCTTMLDNDYRQNPEYESLGIKVVHHSELLPTIISSLDLTTEPEEITYHDPCYLARGRNITKEPRSVLKLCGSEIKEMKHSGHNTSCCGAGGGQIFNADDKKDNKKERVNVIRLEEIKAVGVKTVAVACPDCHTMLQQEADLKILDIAEIIAARIKPKEEKATKMEKDEDIVEIEGVKFRRHPNGGGLVAETAYVAPTVHVGPMAVVSENAHLEGDVCLTGKARLGGTVRASSGVFGGTFTATEGTYDHRKIYRK